MKNIIFIALIILSLSPMQLFAQEGAKSNANQKYLRIKDEMQKVYNDGDVDSVVNIFNTKCCKKIVGNKYFETIEFNSINENIRADIYLLLIRSKIALEETEGNDKYMRKLFAIQYDQTFEDEWLSIKAERAKYHISHKTRLGVSVGANLSNGNPTKDYFMLQPTYGGSSGGTKDYNVAVGYSLGFAFEYYLTKNLAFEVQAKHNQINFAYKKNHKWGDDYYISTNNIHQNNLKYIELPLIVRWTFDKKLKPHIETGFVPAYLLSAEQKLEYTITESIGFDQANTYLKTIEIKDQIRKGNMSLHFGAGFSFDIGNNAFKLNAFYRYGMENITNENTRLDNKELMYRFLDLIDDLTINQMGITLTYLYSLSYKAFNL